MTWYCGLFIHKPWYISGLSGIATFIILIILYFISVDINLFWLFGKSPTMAEIRCPETSQASELYSADGVLIGKYFSENRTPVVYEDVNSVFWQALIDTEDERFYSHRGIDFIGLVAAIKDFVVRHDARGASTITQQLAKNMFRMRTQYTTGLLGRLPGLGILIKKSKEWIIAFKVEHLFNKEEILTMYANTVDFGSNSFGIKTATKTYFATTPKEITTEQAAVLVGMLKATTYYNPKINPENSLKRRNVVLKNMYAHNHLTKRECDSLSLLPIDLDRYNVETNYDGQASYFREAVTSYLKEWCNESGYDLFTDGLKIYATIDSRLQAYADSAVVSQMEIIQKTFDMHWGKANPWRDERYNEIPDFVENIAKRLPIYKILSERFKDNPDTVWSILNEPHTVKVFDYKEGRKECQMSVMDSIRYATRFMHCGLVAMEPQTGFVKAWVGDIDFDTWKYDKVTALRQPGSTFKLFVYSEAMNQGLTPCDMRTDSYFEMKVWDEQKQKEVLWAPSNANGFFTNANMPLKSAFAQSVNSIAAKLGQEVGIKNISNTAHLMGIKSPLTETPALALGASDVTLLELTNAYATVVDDGVMHEPVLVTRILDRYGNEIYRNEEKKKQALPYRTAFLMQQMLIGGLREPGGTSMNLWHYVRRFNDVEFGGKTGTSNNHSDAWFIAVSPKMVVGAWVGGEYRAIHFRTGELGQGSRTALPVCGRFIEAVLADPKFKDYHERFPKPKEEIEFSAYNCASYYYQEEDSLSNDTTIVTESVLDKDKKVRQEDTIITIK